MWIVRLALRRPYTFVVMSILIFGMGFFAIFRTPTDIFPNINIPVISIIWNYAGLVPKDMNDRIIYVTERALTTTVDNIEHIESQSLYGVAVVKVFLQPTASVERGIAQITAVSQTQLRQLPAGTTPPLILAYSASSVPVLQLALSGQGLSEQQLNDYGLNFIRTQLITVEGASVPYPYGGKQRQVQVDLNPDALQSKGLSALDVVNAISLQNLILPTGTSKIGGKEYDVDVPNAAPQTIEELNPHPHKNHRRHHHLRPGCRLDSRRFSSANQHRPRRWAAFRPPHHSKSRRRFYAKSNCGHQVSPPADRQHPPASIKNGSSRRSIHLRLGRN